MALTKQQYRQFFSVLEEQFQLKTKEAIIESYFELFYEHHSGVAKNHALRLMGGKKKNAKSLEAKKIFESVYKQVLISIIDNPRRLRFTDISKELSKACPEIEWLGTGMPPLEPEARNRYQKSIRTSKWLTELNNKYFASKGDIAE